MRLSPVAIEKIAVLRATARPGVLGAGAAGRLGRGRRLALRLGGRRGGWLARHWAMMLRTRVAATAARSRAGAPRYTSPPPHGQHRLTEEADRPRGARASREPALHLDDQDVLPPPAGRRRGRRRRRGRHRAPP